MPVSLEKLGENQFRAVAPTFPNVDITVSVNSAGAIGGDDAFVMYYAYTNANLVGDGETGGTERFRRLLLASYASQDNPTDDDLKAMLKRANELREEFG